MKQLAIQIVFILAGYQNYYGSFHMHLLDISH